MVRTRKQTIVVEPSKEERDAIEAELKRFLEVYENFLTSDTGGNLSESSSIIMGACHVSLVLNNALLGRLEETDHRSEFCKGIFQKVGHALKPKKDVEAEIVRRGLSDAHRLIVVQIMMRMVMWTDCPYEDYFIWTLLDAVMGPPADQPSTEPRKRMVNELHSLAQLAVKHAIVPQDAFTEWLQSVLTPRVSDLNPYKHDDVKFVSDVLEYQLKDDVVPGIPLNVPDSIGRDFEEKSAKSPLVQGSVKQSRDQDSQACDDGSSSSRMGESAYEAGRFSAGNEDAALEILEGSRKVLNLSPPVSGMGINDRTCLLDALDSILDGNTRRKVHAYMRETCLQRATLQSKLPIRRCNPMVYT